ncbi:MAG: hypothetical protein PHR35_09505 [Kiritimatiellae bacterium]|nr:hypothetical protein [Kiritimatiellia bacterium]
MRGHCIVNGTIGVAKRPSHIAPAALLGQQIEACYEAVTGLLSDRLANAKFAWPADARTGIAHKWRPTFTTMPGLHCELTPHVSLSGNESQMIHCYWPETELAGIQQNGRQVRAGETLELELWAKAMSTPVNLRVGLKPLSTMAPVYAQADICVDAAYWKRYTAVFKMPRDDDEAIFFIRLRGEGKVWLDQVHLRPAGEGPLCAAVMRGIASLRIPVLRFPGGTETNGYHWRHGIGPTHLRPSSSDPEFKGMLSQYDFGTDEYLALCHEQGITPHLVLNLGTGTPEEAAEWAAYCARWFEARHVKPPLIYFEMGNEQDGHHELGHMTPEMYVAALRDFVPLLRQAYPAARIIGQGHEHYYYLRADQLKPWRQTVLAQAADLVDVFSTHLHQGLWGETDEQRQANVIRCVNRFRKGLENLIRDIREAGCRHPVAVTEWTMLIHAGQSDGRGFLEPYDAMHCQYVACVLHTLARLGRDVELASFYQLVNLAGVFLHRQARVEETPMAEIFRLYRPVFPGEVLPLTNNSPMLDRGAPSLETATTAAVDSVPQTASAAEEAGQTVDALAVRRDGRTWLFLVNLHSTASIRLNLRGFPAKADETVLLAGDSPVGTFHTGALEYVSGDPVLPPLAVVRLCYNDDV